jgi:hypothetical protein
MGYSLLLVRVPPGTSDNDVGKLALAANEAERMRPPGPPDPGAERRKRALVEALLAECPELQGGEVDYASIARAFNISEDEARQRYRWWHLVGPDEGAGIEITVYDSFVAIDMASAGGTDEDWEDIWHYLAILVREGGFVVWDPQGPNVVDVTAGPLGDGKRTKRPKRATRRRGRTSGTHSAVRAADDDAVDAGDDEAAEAEGEVESEDVRRGGEIAKLINRIVDEAIAAPLAAAGFRRSGRTWRRHLDNGAVHVVNVQWSPRDRGVEGWFALNAGVYFPALAESLALYPMTNAPKEYDCHVRRRPSVPGRNGWRVRVPGVATPDPDVKGLLACFFSWLDRRADNKAVAQHATAVRELREVLERHAFPWLEGVSTLPGARDALLRGPDMFWAAHASLLLGEREEAAQILKRVLARANPEFAETVRTWGRTQGLIA